MLDFDLYLMRHGECWIQEIVEGIERSQGIQSNVNLPLEQRWYAAMHSDAAPRQQAA